MDKVIVIGGSGKIGAQLAEALSDDGYQVVTVGRKMGVCVIDGNLRIKIGEFQDWPGFVTKDVIAGFITIPSTPDGNAERNYIRQLIRQLGVPFVVTGAKGALANHWHEFGLEEIDPDDLLKGDGEGDKRLNPILDHLGYGATVGSGHLLTDIGIFSRLPDVTEIHVVPNVTTSLIIDAVASGKTPEDGIALAVSCGATESPLESKSNWSDSNLVIQGEADDIAMKAVILYNHIGFPKSVVRIDGGFRLRLDREHFLRFKKSPYTRFVVSIYRSTRVSEAVRRSSMNDAGFYKSVGGRLICGRFADIRTDMSLRGLEINPMNCSAIISTETMQAAHKCGGPGAGVSEVVSAMMSDFASFTS